MFMPREGEFEIGRQTLPDVRETVARRVLIQGLANQLPHIVAANPNFATGLVLGRTRLTPSEQQIIIHDGVLR